MRVQQDNFNLSKLWVGFVLVNTDKSECKTLRQYFLHPKIPYNPTSPCLQTIHREVMKEIEEVAVIEIRIP